MISTLFIFSLCFISPLNGQKALCGVNGILVKDQVLDCSKLYCQDLRAPRLAVIGVAEGSYCGEGLICLHGECVPDPALANHSNTGIPDPQQFVPRNVPSRDEQCKKTVPFSTAAKMCRNGPCVLDPTVTNYPNAGISHHQQFVPGNIPSRDEQCKQKVPFSIAAKDQVRNCTTLWCQDLNNKYRYPLDPPVEGTYCGERSVCSDGQCITNPNVYHEW